MRRQELIEAPKPGEPPPNPYPQHGACGPPRSFSAKTPQFRNGNLYLGDREIPTDGDREMTINYAGPADTFPRVSLLDFIRRRAIRQSGSTGAMGQRQDRSARPG